MTRDIFSVHSRKRNDFSLDIIFFSNKIYRYVHIYLFFSLLYWNINCQWENESWTPHNKIIIYNFYQHKIIIYLLFVYLIFFDLTLFGIFSHSFVYNKFTKIIESINRFLMTSRTWRISTYERMNFYDFNSVLLLFQFLFNGCMNEEMDSPTFLCTQLAFNMRKIVIDFILFRINWMVKIDSRGR